MRNQAYGLPDWLIHRLPFPGRRPLRISNECFISPEPRDLRCTPRRFLDGCCSRRLQQGRNRRAGRTGAQSFNDTGLSRACHVRACHVRPDVGDATCDPSRRIRNDARHTGWGRGQPAREPGHSRSVDHVRYCRGYEGHRPGGCAYQAGRKVRYAGGIAR